MADRALANFVLEELPALLEEEADRIARQKAIDDAWYSQRFEGDGHEAGCSAVQGMQDIAPPGDGLAAPTSTLARLMTWHRHGVWQAVRDSPPSQTLAGARGPLHLHTMMCFIDCILQCSGRHF